MRQPSLVALCAIAALWLSASGLAAQPQVIVDEDFSGSLSAWGLPGQGGALTVDSSMVLVPMFRVGDATIEYRGKVEGQGLLEFLFRYDLDTDDYYIFRVDTRPGPESAPGFLKRNHGEPPWVFAGERTGQIPPPDTWVDVKVEIEGGVFRGFVDGQLVATLEDADFAVGGFAFRRQLTKAWVDDLRISVPEGSAYTVFTPEARQAKDAPAPYTQGDWQGHWIWSPGEEEDLTRALRKSFDIPGTIREARVAVTCDNEYELFINGQRVGADEDWYSLELHDVRDLLKPGTNTVAALCTNLGPGSAGLLLELGVITDAGDYLRISSDPTWKAAKAPAEGWTEAGFDDADWENATSVGKHPCAPWATQSALRLPYLGPKQPIELVSAKLPERITVGEPFETIATWKPAQALTGDYPIVVTARQGDGPVFDLCTVQPAQPATEWAVGEAHTETISAELWPDAGYLLRAGKLDVGLELRGTFHSNRRDSIIGQTTFEAPVGGRSLAMPTVLPPAPATEGSFTDPAGREHPWSLDAEGRIMMDGTPYLPLDADGVYWCDAQSAGDALAALDWKPIVQAICARGGPSGADFVRVRLVDHVDATKTDHEFSEDGGLGGNSRVLTIGDREYRVTAARDRLSYFAYTANCRRPRNPHLMMFQSVNDIERYTTVRIQPPWDNVGGGVYTGREFPCDGQPFEHRFLFYPREESIRFTVSRWPVEKPTEANSGAAVSHLWLFELTDPLAARPVSVPGDDGPERRLGMYLTHPAYMYSLYGYRAGSDQERQASLRSFIDYLKFCGINLLEFNAVDGGDTTGTAFYDSEIWPRSAGNLLAELIPLCEENDIKLLPIITSLSVPEGKFGFTRDSMQTDRFGNLTYFFDSRPPLPDPLRPEVQALLVRNIREILDQSAHSEAVIGIGFRVNGKIGLCYGGSDLGKSDQYTGYSKWDVAEFERDTGLDVPEMDPTPYEWIRANCWDTWLDWRCERTRDFWLRCRDMVQGSREDLVFYASCDMPSETPAWNVYWPEGETPLNCWRYHGVDPRMFAGEPGILLQRGMMIAADRYFSRSGQYARNVEAMKDFHYAPGVAELYEGSEGAACELYYNYWEESGVFNIGEFKTEFWGAATMAPLLRNYFEPIAFSVARTNCHTLNLFSWERGSFGHEHDLRAFARAFRAMPVGDGEDASALVEGSTDGLWVRRFGDRLAVLNNTGQARTVAVRYPKDVPPAAALLEFGRYEILAGPGSVARIELPLKPYELRVLGVQPQ